MFHLCGSHDPVPEIQLSVAYITHNDIRASVQRVMCLKCGNAFTPNHIEQMPMRLNDHIEKAKKELVAQASDSLHVRKRARGAAPAAGQVLSLHALRWLDGMEELPYVVKLPTPKPTT